MVGHSGFKGWLPILDVFVAGFYHPHVVMVSLGTDYYVFWEISAFMVGHHFVCPYFVFVSYK